MADRFEFTDPVGSYIVISEFVIDFKNLFVSRKTQIE